MYILPLSGIPCCGRYDTPCGLPAFIIKIELHVYTKCNNFNNYLYILSYIPGITFNNSFIYFTLIIILIRCKNN